MPGLVVVGLQWGDEGKGKVSAYLAKGASLAVRFNGGANAGHTVKLGEKSLSLHILPAATVSTKAAAIGPGVYLDIEEMLRDIEKLEAAVGKVHVVISPRAQLVTPLQVELDARIEELRGGGSIGTTRRGIGPTAINKYGRLGVRVCDLLEGEAQNIAEVWRRVWGGLTSLRVEEALEKAARLVEQVKWMVGDVSSLIHEKLSSGETVVFEGAQGTMLDIDHGTYPYVTSSHTVSAAAALGAGVGPKSIHRVVGVAKSYTTRVGAGPFPTEFTGPLADSIRERGGEYGATTGRPRRIGWLDIPQLRYACMLNDADEIFLTRLDTLASQPRVRLCVKYEGSGDSFPESVSSLRRARPVYEELDGWPEIGESERSRLLAEGYGGLPRSARQYVERIEEELGTPIRYIGIGPGIGDVIMK
ncbi:MAG: adenylosuccinate synthase [Nitrososphaerota archaeon]|nr:adenylosuccinate synthase [Candidatus Calditenuaceae archaeon]MDW8072774.1 adenylosuccinate synthase [Nitrososphaerota archaeon]